MPVIGVAELLVTPSFKNLQTDVAKATSALPRAAEPAGSKMGGVLSNALGTALGIGIAKVSSSAMGTLTTVFTKGFARLTAIDTAQAKLRGLGHDADSVKLIMTNATAAVRGTAFGLGDAATTAAGAVAAGIQPGEELERVLKSVANSAAASGSDLNEMGLIYNKVASTGKAQNDVLAQVAERGIPIYAALAKQFGVTTEEVFKMASKGEISFADFEKAMTTASGNVAQEMGKTLPGAMDNYGAALGRVGANLMQGLYPLVTQFVLGATERMKVMEDFSKVAGQTITDVALKVVSFVQSIDITPLISALGAWIAEHQTLFQLLGSGVAGALAAAASFSAVAFAVSKTIAAAKLLGGAVQSLWTLLAANPLTVAIAAIGALVGVMIYLYNTNETVRTAIQAAWTWIADNAVALWQGVILPAMQAVGDWIQGTLVPLFQNLWTGTIQPVFASIAAWVQQTWTGTVLPTLQTVGNWIVTTLVPLLMNLWTGVVQPVFQAVGTFIGWVVTGLIVPAFQAIWDAIQLIVIPVLLALWTQAQAVFTPLANLIVSVWQTFIQPTLVAMWSFISSVLAPVLTWLWQNVAVPTFQGIAAIVAWAWSMLEPIFGFIGAALTGLITVAGALAVGLIAAFQGLVNFWQSVIWPAVTWLWQSVFVPTFQAIVMVVTTAINVVMAIFTGLVAFWNGVLAPAAMFLWSTVFVPVFTGIQTVVSTVVAAIMGVFTALVSFWQTVVAIAVTWLWRTIFQPAFQAIGDVIRTVVDNVIRPALDALVSFWRNVVAPAVTWLRDQIKAAFDAIGRGIKTVWESVIKPPLDAMVSFWRDKVVPEAQTLKKGVTDAFDGLGRNIRDFWNSKVKPIFDGMSKMFTQTLPDGVKRGVDMMGQAWHKLTGLFAKPINAIIDGVWNNGIAKMVNTAAESFGIGQRVATIPLIGGYARGGRVKEDWAWVGEEGPELLYFGSASPHVFTHEQSMGMTSGVTSLLRGRDGALPAGLAATLSSSSAGEGSFSAHQAAVLLAASRRESAPSHMTLRIGQHEFEAVVESVTDSRLSHHVSTLRQPARQRAGL